MEPKNTPHAIFPKLLFTVPGLAHHLINFPRNAEAEAHYPLIGRPSRVSYRPTRAIRPTFSFLYQVWSWVKA